MFPYSLSTGTIEDIYENVRMIRSALTSSEANVLVEFHCYNKAEVEQTDERLTTEERRHVRFFWMTWDKLPEATNAMENPQSST